MVGKVWPKKQTFCRKMFVNSKRVQQIEHQVWNGSSNVHVRNQVKPCRYVFTWAYLSLNVLFWHFDAVGACKLTAHLPVLYPAVRVKRRCLQFSTCLPGHNSNAESAGEQFTCSKDWEGLVLCNEKFLVWGFGFFVSDVKRGGPLWPILFGPGPKPLDSRIELKFGWKLGWNPSPLIHWMTCWRFEFKSYNL